MNKQKIIHSAKMQPYYSYEKKKTQEEITMVKKKGVLCYDRESGRYDIYFGNGSYYGGLHCGDCFDVEMDRDWVPVRIEMDEDWYLVGVPKIRLDGLTVRADWYE